MPYVSTKAGIDLETRIIHGICSSCGEEGDFCFYDFPESERHFNASSVMPGPAFIAVRCPNCPGWMHARLSAKTETPKGDSPNPAESWTWTPNEVIYTSSDEGEDTQELNES